MLLRTFSPVMSFTSLFLGYFDLQRGMNDGELFFPARYLVLYQMAVFSMLDENLSMTSPLWFSLLSVKLFSPHLHLVYQFFRNTYSGY